MKKRLRIIVLVITLLLGVGAIPKESSVNTLTEPTIATYHEEERHPYEAAYVLNPAEFGGGLGGGYNSYGAAIGGGLALLIYTWIKNLINTFNNNNQNSSTNASTNAGVGNPTADDLFNNDGVRQLMDKYGWTRETVCKWIKTMTGISIATFFTIDNHKKEIKIYIGSTEYELSYSDYRDIPNNHFTYFSEEGWKSLTYNITSEGYDAIWALNYVWLVMGMMKNATFVLVTPSINYFDYTKGIPLNNGKNYTPMYARELEAIYSFGYRWSSQVIPLQEARRGAFVTC